MDTQKVLSFFQEITRIPRESGHEEQIIAYLQRYAAARRLECKTDKAGNVLIVKEATPGYEDRPTVVLQSHSDMVCEKNAGVAHDFSKDPIRYEIRDGWMVAPDTTLGADDGIGIAAQLALMDDDTIPHGRIESLFTVSEETGLDGAKALKKGFITGKILLNLDSEDEGELFVGCAGGVDTTALFHYKPKALPVSHRIVRYGVRGGIGGHSGDDIDKGRANALQLLARFLQAALHYKIDLCEIAGGNKRNAIAREASAVVAVPTRSAKAVDELFERFTRDIEAEFATTDPEVTGFSEILPARAESIDTATATRLILALAAAPHGVLAMSGDIKGLVETSSNLASVQMLPGGRIRVGSSQRSAINSAREAAGAKFEAVFALAGAQVTHESEYPGWKPNMDSPIKDLCVAAYRKLFRKDPIVRAIHAGLECGLFLEHYPDLDMISFGPTLRGVHAPGERLELASLDRFWALLLEVLKTVR